NVADGTSDSGSNENNSTVIDVQLQNGAQKISEGRFYPFYVLPSAVSTPSSFERVGGKRTAILGTAAGAFLIGGLSVAQSNGYDRVHRNYVSSTLALTGVALGLGTLVSSQISTDHNIDVDKIKDHFYKSLYKLFSTLK